MKKAFPLDLCAQAFLSVFLLADRYQSECIYCFLDLKFPYIFFFQYDTVESYSVISEVMRLFLLKSTKQQAKHIAGNSNLGGNKCILLPIGLKNGEIKNYVINDRGKSNISSNTEWYLHLLLLFNDIQYLCKQLGRSKVNIVDHI